MPPNNGINADPGAVDVIATGVAVAFIGPSAMVNEDLSHESFMDMGELFHVDFASRPTVLLVRCNACDTSNVNVILHPDAGAAKVWRATIDLGGYSSVMPARFTSRISC